MFADPMRLRRLLPIPPAAIVGLALLVTGGCSPAEKPVGDANKLFIQASESIAKGDQAGALTALDASLAAQPTLWAYRERAKLKADAGDDAAALADCEAALALAPGDVDILWLKGEFTKPKAQRFQGQFKNPPSSNR